MFFLTLSQGADYYSTATYDPWEKGNKLGKSFMLPKFTTGGDLWTMAQGGENQTEPGSLSWTEIRVQEN